MDSEARGSVNGDDALATALAAVPTAVAKEVLNGFGVSRVHLEGISPIAPSSQPIAGPASTLRYLPQREDVPKAPRGPVGRQAVDQLPRGAVLVIDAMGVCEGAVLGDMLAARATYREAAGVVVDGVVRDLAGLRALGLPVFARGAHPDPNGAHLMPWERDVPIQCGGRLVQPGDWILADDDGALVVPGGMTAEVARLGAERNRADQFSQHLLAGGAALDDAYPVPPSRSEDLERFAG